MDATADWSAALQGLTPLLDWRDLPLDVASLAALGRFGGVQLPGGLDVLAHPLVLGVSGFMLAAEFFADKILWFDTLWDAVHTFIRIPAGAALAAAVMGDQGAAAQLAAALAGGTLAAGTHFAKAGARAAINTSPEPVSNVATSFGEDALFAGGLWLLLHQPLWFVAALGVFVLAAAALIVLLWRFVRRLLRPREDIAAG